MSLALVQAGLSALAVDVLKTIEAADRCAGAFAAAAPIVARRDESVGFNRIDRQAALNMLAAFTRLDQSTGMNVIDRMLSDTYFRIFSSTRGLNLPGYGFEVSRDTDFFRDLFAVIRFARPGR